MLKGVAGLPATTFRCAKPCCISPFHYVNWLPATTFRCAKPWCIWCAQRDSTRRATDPTSQTKGLPRIDCVLEDGGAKGGCRVAGHHVSLREAVLYLAISLRELAAGHHVSLREAVVYMVRPEGLEPGRVAPRHPGSGTSVFFKLVRPEGFEPPTPRFEAWYSIQLSYRRARGVLSFILSRLAKPCRGFMSAIIDFYTLLMRLRPFASK